MADATEKKYVDLTGLTSYDAKIKALIDSKDETALASAKSYADGLAKNYDAAGSATTALADAKTYTDGKIATANEAIAAAKTQADKGVADAASAKAAADKAQGEVDALETLVGTIPAGATATTVTGYVDEKVGKATTDLTALTGRVTQAEKDIDAIEADYLKASDKTELQGNIDAVGGKVTTLIGTDTGKSVRTIANEELAAQLIPDGAKESLDTLQEIAAWIQAHPDDASAMNQAITALQNLVGTLPEGVTQTNVVDYVKALIAAEQSRAEGVESGLNTRLAAVEAKFTGDESVAKQIENAVAAEKAERVAADQAHDTAIAAAKKAGDDAQADVDALEEVVATKAAQSDLAALTGRVTTAEGKITTLEGASHTHTNKADLDAITAQKLAAWDDAATKTHTHSNKDVLDGITSAKVSAWDAAESNAKKYTDAEIAKFVPVTTEDINKLFPSA